MRVKGSASRSLDVSLDASRSLGVSPSASASPDVSPYASASPHTHTVCVPYYKATPYNISHTKNFSMAIFTLIFFYKFFLCMYTMHEKWGQFLACTDI